MLAFIILLTHETHRLKQMLVGLEKNYEGLSVGSSCKSEGSTPSTTWFPKHCTERPLNTELEMNSEQHQVRAKDKIQKFVIQILKQMLEFFNYINKWVTYTT